jgi:hypothetical protein
MLLPVSCLLFHASINSSTEEGFRLFRRNKLSACSLRSTAGKLTVIADESKRRFSL